MQDSFKEEYPVWLLYTSLSLNPRTFFHLLNGNKNLLLTLAYNKQDLLTISVKYHLLLNCL